MLNPTVTPQPLRLATPLEDHLAEAGLLVKREDLSCPEPGPPFSKTRGVIAHMAKKVAEGVRLFGALDTYHSQAGHAVAYGARLLGVDSVNYFPVYKAERVGPDKIEPNVAYIGLGDAHARIRPPQLRSSELGARLHFLPAGRSALLYWAAKKDCETQGGYMMPNALKLPETVAETEAEVVRTFEHATREQFEVLRRAPWLISASSATIASGVIAGVRSALGDGTKKPLFILHLGYSRSHDEVFKYLADRLKTPEATVRQHVRLVDEGYAYKYKARPGPTPPWPCNDYYDLKALRWWLASGRAEYGRAVFWNIG